MLVIALVMEVDLFFEIRKVKRGLKDLLNKEGYQIKILSIRR